jgi:uncharacterized protein (TIGR02594 family)
MILEKALSQWGIQEIPGEEHNPEVLKYFEEIGHAYVKSDETAWCSAFMNWVAKKAGKERSGKLNARSWLKVGEEVDEPIAGDVVIFWRSSRDSWKGHVGIYVNETEEFINVLGGNQNNKVCIKAYPKERFLGYRRLRDVY